MTQHRDLGNGEVLPASLLDALQEFVGSQVSPNFGFAILGGTQVRVPAGTGNDQVAIAINGRWRYRTTNADSAAIPGGTAAGVYDTYVTASDNSFAAGDVDNTVYAFGVEVRTSGVPATALYRKVAQTIWSGTAIVGITPLLQPVNVGELPIGAELAYTGTVLPNVAGGAVWDWADGGLIDRSAFATFYSRTGHAYNGGVDPGSNKVRKPDKRGRHFTGADSMGTALTTAAAGSGGRIPNNPRAVGQNGGAERVTLAALESGVNPNGSVVAVGTHSHGAATAAADRPLDHTHGTNIDFGAAANNGTGAAVTVPVPGNRVSTGANISLDHLHGISADGAHGHALTNRAADSPHQNLGPYEVDQVIVRIA